MRVNQEPLTPGEKTMVGDHALAVSSDGEAAIQFGKAEPTTGEAARINAALAAYGLRVSRYWKIKAMAVEVPPAPGRQRAARIPVAPGLTVTSKGATSKPVATGVAEVAAHDAAVAGIAAAITAKIDSEAAARPTAPLIFRPAATPIVTCLTPSPYNPAWSCMLTKGHTTDHDSGHGTSPRTWPIEPEPTAPIGFGTPTSYQTWSGARVVFGGQATYGRLVLEPRQAAASGVLAPDDVRRLNTAMTGWGMEIMLHPRTGVQVCLVEPPAGSGQKRRYMPIGSAAAIYSHGFKTPPANAQPGAGLTVAQMTRPVCGDTNSPHGGANAPCQEWPGHVSDHKDVYGRVWTDANIAAARESASVLAALSAGKAEAIDMADEPEDEPEADLPEGAHVYVPHVGLVPSFDAAIKGMQEKGRLGPNFLFIGPSGSGKGDGAAFLAAKYGLPFTKIDAASVTEPEAWFGTREVVERNGVPVTEYKPSMLVESVQQPGMTFVDEITRARTAIHNIFLPLLDGTRKVTNPLSGQVIHRHPQNVLVLAANRGLEFTGTFDLDPALTSRVRTIVFGYPEASIEKRILRQASGCTDQIADVIVRFASQTRAKAKQGSTIGLAPMSVREAIAAACDAADGLPVSLAVANAYINVRPDDGGKASAQQVAKDIWAAVAPASVDGPVF